MNKRLLPLLSIALITQLHADTIELDEVIVEAANRTGQNLKDITETATIITQQEIEESRVTTLSEALTRLGNIIMTNNGGPGQPTSMLLRGFDSKRVLVLVDGIRINDVTGLSGAQFEQVMLDNIERIEIIKGAQSGIWGADASAGVINIVTKTAQEGTHTLANIEQGSFNTQKASAQVSHKSKDFSISIGASRYETQGYSVAEPTRTSPDYGKRGSELNYETDAYINKTYNAQLAYYITEGDRLEANYRYIDSYIENDFSGLDLPNGPFTVNEIDNYVYSLAFKHTDSTNDLTAVYNYSRFKRSQYGGYDGNTEEFSLQDKINYAENSFLRLGGSYLEYAQNTSGGTGLDKDYTNKAAFASNYNKFTLLDSLGETIFSQSIRYDRYDTLDNKTTGKIGLKQFLHNDIYLSSNYGTAYNVPTLYQLYDGFSGNQNLKPETTKSFDISLGNDQFSASYFYNKITDLIDYDFTTSAFANIEGTSRLEGVELNYQDDFFDTLAINANYTYLSAKNGDGQRLARRPKHQINVNGTYYLSDALNIALNAQYIGQRYDALDNSGAQTGKYLVMNAVINYEINENVAIYLKADNLTDKYYQVVDGYATAERSYYSGLSAKF